MEQSLDQAVGFPPSAANDGSIFGVPIWLALILLVLLMWMAREPLRRVLWQVFFITGRVFGRWGLWLTEHGRAARAASNEKIAAHRADELQDRMLVLEDRMAKSGDQAEAFVRDLTERTEAAFLRERQELESFRGELEGPGAPPLMPWDVFVDFCRERVQWYNQRAHRALKNTSPALRVMIA